MMSISSSSAFSGVVEGQGAFRQPPSDNYDLALDPYQAAASFVLPCAYVKVGVIVDYTWAKDGVSFEPSTSTIGNTVLSTVPVPDGDYDSSLEGTYTCSVSIDLTRRGSRNIIVTLPGELCLHHTSTHRSVYVHIRHPNLICTLMCMLNVN